MKDGETVCGHGISGFDCNVCYPKPAGIPEEGPEEGIDPILLANKKKRILLNPRYMIAEEEPRYEEVELVYKESGGNPEPGYLPLPIVPARQYPETPNSSQLILKRLLQGYIPQDPFRGEEINIEATDALILELIKTLPQKQPPNGGTT
jgi:hypothetical protein